MKKLLSIIFVFIFKISFAEVKLPRLVRDSMVLQRDAKVKIWGRASPKENIEVSFQNKKYKTIAEANGNWKIFLSPLKAGGPFTMHIDATNKIILNNILVGDVWICSGQSNMVHQMELHSSRYTDEIAKANYPEIRHFWIPTLTDLQKPQDDLPAGYWKSANPVNVLQFSAVAYFFAKKIYEKYHIPIGLINSSVGGPSIESWMSEESLKNIPSVITAIEKNKDTSYVNNINRNAFRKNSAIKWPQDKGMVAVKTWYLPSYTPVGWRNINVPGYWEDQGIKNLDGIVWYRKTIEVPSSMTNAPAKIFLGRIVDADFVYLNGNLIGNTTYQYPQRSYNIPLELLKQGKNLLVIKVINNSGKGGFVTDNPFFLMANSDTIDLKGTWQYKVGAMFSQDQNITPGFSYEYQPTALYNAMIAPLINYTIKGFLWYQGEGSINEGAQYGNRLTTLVNDWRDKWQQGNLPFLFVQLPNFGDMEYTPVESSWAELRESELKTLSVPNTGMAVAIDVGEWNDIHPDRKKEVGDRLALAAEKIAYREKIVYSGPIYQSQQIDGNKIILSFNNIGSGLITNDGEELSEFAIAGADKKFVWAKAKIEGDKIIVWSDDVTNPMYVRYAWADNPVNPNLFNKEGLPASPFTTDAPIP